MPVALVPLTLLQSSAGGMVVVEVAQWCFGIPPFGYFPIRFVILVAVGELLVVTFVLVVWLPSE